MTGTHVDLSFQVDDAAVEIGAEVTSLLLKPYANGRLRRLTKRVTDLSEVASFIGHRMFVHDMAEDYYAGW